MLVKNMTSNAGNKIANQFIIVDNENNKTYFQSYKSIIVMVHNGKVYLDSYYWDYSNTTGRFRNMFLNETIVDTRKKIDSGEYVLTDLNERE